MNKKRGRPILIQSDDPAIIRRREKTGERVRRYLDRKKAKIDSTAGSAQAQSEQSGGTTISVSQNALQTPVTQPLLDPPGLQDVESTQEHDDAQDQTNHEGVTGRIVLHNEDTDFDAPVCCAADSLCFEEICQDGAIAGRQIVNTLSNLESMVAGPELAVQSERDRTVSAIVVDQNLLRRRELSKLRARRHRDQKRILKGLPKRSRKEKLHPGERLINIGSVQNGQNGTFRQHLNPFQSREDLSCKDLFATCSLETTSTQQRPSQSFSATMSPQSNHTGSSQYMSSVTDLGVDVERSSTRVRG